MDRVCIDTSIITICELTVTDVRIKCGWACKNMACGFIRLCALTNLGIVVPSYYMYCNNNNIKLQCNDSILKWMHQRLIMSWN